MRLAVVVNPVSGRGRSAEALRRYVERVGVPGWDVELLATRGPGHAGEIANRLALDPPDRVAVCGGDGTVNEVVSALPSPPFPVGVIPAGTSNVLAREIGLPAEPVAALALVVRGKVRRVDLGGIRTNVERRFLLMAGAGLDAFVAARVRLPFKARLGHAAYYEATLRGLVTYRFPRFRVRTDRGDFEATSCLLTSTRFYGGGLVFAPGADITDGELDLVLIGAPARLAHAVRLVRARMGLGLRSDTAARVRSARLEGPPDVEVQVDGEAAGTLPASVWIEPRVFPLIVR